MELHGPAEHPDEQMEDAEAESHRGFQEDSGVPWEADWMPL